MKKIAPIQVEIPKPCSELWAGMTPAAQGRFCASCQKTVIDFSRMSDKEIIDTLENLSGHSCGHFHVSQLGRGLTDTYRTENPSIKQWLIRFILAIGLLNVHKADAKALIPSELAANYSQKPQCKPGPDLDTAKVHTIKGCVIDRTHQRLSFANMRIKGVGQWQADVNGDFTFTLPDTVSSEKLLLEVKYLGYADTTIELSVHKLPANLEILMGDAVVYDHEYTRGVAFVVARDSFWHRVKRSIRRTFKR